MSLIASPGSYLLSAADSEDHYALELLLSTAQDALSALEPGQLQEYLRLARLEPYLASDLGEALRDLHQQSQHKARTVLAAALHKVAGRAIDLDRSHLVTRILDVDGPKARERLERRTLWEAAQSNFGFHLGSRWRLGSGERYIDASHIEENGQPSGLSVQAFIDAVRTSDPGSKALDHMAEYFQPQILGRLRVHRRDALRLALLEALRSGEISHHEYRRLLGDIESSTANWPAYALKLGGDALPIQLFVRRYDDLEGAPTFSYFPDRPGGALKRHVLHSEALDSLREQLGSDLERRPAWLMRRLSTLDQVRLLTFLKTPAVDTTQLNWLASQLYLAFGDASAPAERIRLELYLNEVGNSLLDSLVNAAGQVIYSDIAAQWRPTRDADHQTWVEGLKYMASELLDLLLLPVPGGVTGLSKVMLGATLGTLAYQVYSASRSWSEGQRIEAVQAFGDVLDLAVGALLQGYGSRLSARRVSRLVEQMGSPLVAIRADGRPELQWSPTHHDVAPALNDEQRLGQLLHPALAPVAADLVPTLLRLADLERPVLDAIAQGRQPAPWQMNHLIERYLQRLTPDQAEPANRPDHPTLESLHQRFTHLSWSATQALLQAHPELAGASADKPLNTQQLATLVELRDQSRYLDALASLDDALGHGLNADGESLLGNLLPQQPGWPADLAIRVFAGARTGGDITRTRQVIRTYGEDTASHFLDLVCLDERYLGHDPRNDDLVGAYPGEHPLAGVVLRVLDDNQRTALGMGIRDGALLVRRIVEQARLFAPSLRPELLALGNTYPLSRTRLAHFRLPQPLDGQAANANGIVEWAGKLYIEHAGDRFQVLRDTDASSPGRLVWRIVDPTTAVADSPDNTYVATRPGRTEPVLRDAEGAWVGVATGLAGGQPPRRQPRISNLYELVSLIESDDPRLFSLNDQLNRLGIETVVAVRQINATDAQANPGQLLALRGQLDDTTQRYLASNDELIGLLERKVGMLQEHDNRLRVQAIDRHYSSLQAQRATSLMRLATAYRRGARFLEDQATRKIHDLGALHPLDNPSTFLTQSELYLAMLDQRLPLMAKEQEVRRSLQTLLDTWLVQFDTQTRKLLERDLAVLEAEPQVALHELRNAQLFFCACVLTGGVSRVDLQMYSKMLECVELSNEARVAYSTLQDLAALPAQHAVPLIETLENQFRGLAETARGLAVHFPGAREKALIERMEAILLGHTAVAAQALGERLREIDDGNRPQRNDQDIDQDFLPIQPGPTNAPTTRRRVVTVHYRRGRALVSGELQAQDTELVVRPSVSGALPSHYQRRADGTWGLRHEADRRPLAQLRKDAQVALETVDSQIREADQQRASGFSTNFILDQLELHSDRVRTLAHLIEAQEPGSALTGTLETAAQRLRDHRQALQTLAYKDKEVLDINRLRFLIQAGELSIRQSTRRQPQGKGQSRHYLDVYQVCDRVGDKPLWEAHFHYPREDSAALDYPFHGGHLKKLDQARKGRRHQAAQEQAGLPVTPIWRETLDRDTAGLLFALAGTAE